MTMQRSTKVFSVNATAIGQHTYGEAEVRAVTYRTVREWIRVAGSHDPMRTESTRTDYPLTGCETTVVYYHNNGLPITQRWIIYPR